VALISHLPATSRRRTRPRGWPSEKCSNEPYKWSAQGILRLNPA
jgi:hypothetical protein